MLTKHLDLFVSPPGEYEVVYCRVCGCVCRTSRAVHGPTSWASAMARKHAVHDTFACPHAPRAWHQQAKKLVVERDQTSSPRLRQVIQQDLDDLLTLNVSRS